MVVVGSLGTNDPGRRRPAAEGDGRRERDARQLLRRRPARRCRGRPRPRPAAGRCGCRPAGPRRRVEPPGVGADLRSTRSCAGCCRSSRGWPPWSAVPLSIDTTKAEVARRALAAGAAIINDITAMGADPDMARVVAEAGAGVVLMHMRGVPKTMQDDPRYDDVVGEVYDFLARRVDWAESRGIPRRRIAVDPGIGFGKTMAHNLDILRNLHRFATLGCAVLVGTSRKKFLGTITGRAVGDRATASAVSSLAACVAGRGSCGSTTYRQRWMPSRSGGRSGAGGSRHEYERRGRGRRGRRAECDHHLEPVPGPGPAGEGRRAEAGDRRRRRQE